jgi:hypothetical protein
MRIGIVVVFMVSERNERLLDLHLRHVEENTENPYTIYACVNGLLPQFRARLEQDPRVKICPCEPYPGGSALWRSGVASTAPSQAAARESKYEHSWYLEQLIRAAIEDGVSHVAMFHVDSFPIRRGWDARLIEGLSDRCMLAGITRDPQRDHKPLTACILFTREFYLRYRPRLLLSPEEMASEAYQRYAEAYPHVSDSGFGYGFTMFKEGLSWNPLIRSNPADVRALFASVYGDLVFHLHAAVYVERTRTVGFTVRPSQRRGLVGSGAKLARVLLPEPVKQKIRACLAPRLEAHCQQDDRNTWEQERRWFLDNPDSYLIYLRTGVRA